MVTIKNIRTSITYENLEKPYAGTVERRCIDGSIHGCGSCKGYCRYYGHPGFLTQKMIAEKCCIEKGCDYFLPKTKRVRPIKRENNVKDILSTASSALTMFDGLRVVRAKQTASGSWTLYYAQIADYDSDILCKNLSTQCDFDFSLSLIPCDFYTAVRLVYGKM